MNLWECGNPQCSRTCVGTGGAVGLRAIGWFFEPGPLIYCPEHRPDADPQDCPVCIADIVSYALQRQIDPAYAHVPVLAMEHVKHLAKEKDDQAADQQ